ncbi:MAG: helix-turn-helix domain-containing protein [Lentisphaeria bacterium]|nr:helix-turn-helix domain-containing protein [Lentisphaeria bacterium]
MEQDNENRNTSSDHPVENDLFDIPEAAAPAASAAVETSPVESAAENAAEPVAEPLADSAPAEPAPELVTEPEFKVNPEDRAAFRMLDSSAAVETSPAESAEAKPKVSLRSSAGASLGKMLTEARTAAGFSVQEASQETRIRPEYIEALENDRADSLPNPVFLRAYVRALIHLYGLDAESTALVEEQMADVQTEVEVPEKLLEEIGKDGQISETETRRIKSIIIYGSIILLLLISLTVTSIITVSIRNRRQQARQQQENVPPFDSGRIEKLIPPAIPQPQILPVPAPAGEPQPAAH